MFKPTDEIRVKAQFVLSTNPNFQSEKKWIAANGEKLVSHQELDLYHILLEERDFRVEYERAFVGAENTLYPDFTIEHIPTGNIFVWEHLGMTNNEHYLNAIPKKIEWFRANGLETVEVPNGKLIITFYNKDTFYKDIRRAIQKIKAYG
jgi:hypothetical protein